MTGSSGAHKSGRKTVVIGTRGSPLALAQARQAMERLAHAALRLGLEMEFEIAIVKTTGDRIQDRALSEIGGKGLFTKEIEDALLSGAIDLAVHSMKDVLTMLPAGLSIAAMLEREDPRDALIARKGAAIAELPRGALFGTASLRRQAQTLALRPDLRAVTMRGNVETRIAKVAKGEVDATLLALAGLKRLGRTDAASAILPIDIMLPAAGQGAIGIEARENDSRLMGLLQAVSHQATAIAVAAERAFLHELEGDCRTPIAAYAELSGDRVRLSALVAQPDGSSLARAAGEAGRADALALGRDIARRLKAASKHGAGD